MITTYADLDVYNNGTAVLHGVIQRHYIDEMTLEEQSDMLSRRDWRVSPNSILVKGYWMRECKTGVRVAWVLVWSEEEREGGRMQVHHGLTRALLDIDGSIDPWTVDMSMAYEAYLVAMNQMLYINTSFNAL